MSEGLSTHCPIKDGQIRLIKVSRSLIHKHKVKCQYHAVDLRKVPKYTAISYVWGNDSLNHKLEISKTFVLSLTASAYEILSEISKGKLGGVLIWMDAVCIDQDNDVEKRQQINIMGTIYSSAAQVLGWLGPDVDGGDEALVLVSKLAQLLAEYEQLQVSPGPEAVQKLKSLATRESDWEALANLFRCSFFERMWIVQEMVMAPFKLKKPGGDVGALLVSRKQSLSLLHLAYVAKRFHDLETHIKPILPDDFGVFPRTMRCVQNMGGLRSMRSQNTPIPFDAALRSCSKFRAKHGVDKIYAIKNFVHEEDPILATLQLDPTNQVLEEELFTQVAAVFMEREDPFQFLNLAGIGWPTRLPSLPSWVPDWNRQDPFVNFGDPTAPKTFRASLQQCQNPVVNRVDKTLTVEIIRVDRVSRIFGYSPDETLASEAPSSDTSSTASSWVQTSPRGFENLARRVSEARAFALTSPSYRPFLPNILGSVLGPYLVGGGIVASEPDMAYLFQTWLRWSESPGGESLSLREKGQHAPDWIRFSDPDFIKFCDAISMAHGGRKAMFGTQERGFLGWGPPGLRPASSGSESLLREGDVLCIVVGGLTPFLLRPLESGGADAGFVGQRFQVVGECYVQGLMKGEGLSLGRRETCMLV